MTYFDHLLISELHLDYQKTDADLSFSVRAHLLEIVKCLFQHRGLLLLHSFTVSCTESLTAALTCAVALGDLAKWNFRPKNNLPM